MANKKVLSGSHIGRMQTVTIPNGTAYNLVNATAAANTFAGANLGLLLPGDQIEVLDGNTVPAAGTAYMFRAKRDADGTLQLQQNDGTSTPPNRA